MSTSNGSVHLGFEVGSGEPVSIPLRHMVVTGQTQEAGKTTTLEALIARAEVKAVAFVTKRGEGSFADARRIRPYFREQADWQFVASILEASRGEKLKFERSWIIRASKGAKTLADVQHNVRKLMDSAKRGMDADVYLVLDAYLDAVVPQIETVRWAPRVELQPGVNAMDLTGLNVEMQHLVIRSTIDWVLHHEEDTVVVVPEAWKFIPQGRGTPVKLGAEAYIRQAAGLRNYLWLDSQDIAGVEKMILKSVPVWILGVQRESNEVKRTLAQIPAGIKKPKPEAVATLGLGEFYACWGSHITKVYAQPRWMGQAEAQAVAEGRIDRPAPPRRTRETSTREETVTPEEASELREENARLQRRISDLEKLIGKAPSSNTKARASAPELGRQVTGDAGLTPVGAHPAPFAARDDEEFYQALKRRLTAEAPALLKVLAERPELQVHVDRPVIEAKGDTLRGRIAQLLADDFFAGGQSAPGTQKELGRRGYDPGPANVYKELDAFALLGFLTIEAGKDDRGRARKEYRAVAGMKINILEPA